MMDSDRCFSISVWGHHAAHGWFAYKPLNVSEHRVLNQIYITVFFIDLDYNNNKYVCIKQAYFSTLVFIEMSIENLKNIPYRYI